MAAQFGSGGGAPVLSQSLRVAPEHRTNRMKVVDIDGDGKLDVVTTDAEGNIGIVRGAGGRSF